MIEQLHELEKNTYNWDELKIEIFWEGNCNVRRKDYDFTSEDNFTSYPEGAIKRKYYHHKWIPVFSDYGGNFSGIDMDPDINGNPGQIIVYGRNEDKMFVIARSLLEFFDLTIQEIKRYKHIFLDDKHLHEICKELIVPNQS